MSVISTADYKELAGYYTAAMQSLSGISDEYYNAALVVVNLQAFDPEIDLLVPFYNAYVASITAYATAPQSIVNAVKSLQDHILAREDRKSVV